MMLVPHVELDFILEVGIFNQVIYDVFVYLVCFHRFCIVFALAVKHLFYFFHPNLYFISPITFYPHPHQIPQNNVLLIMLL